MQGVHVMGSKEAEGDHARGLFLGLVEILGT